MSLLTASNPTNDPNQSEEFVDLLNGEILAGFPGTMAFANQQGIFDRMGGGSDVELNIQSRDMDAMLTAARAGLELVAEHLPGAQARPVPGVDFAEPELRLIPNDRRITEAGWGRQQMSVVVRALGDGVYVGDFFDGDRRLDIVLRAPEWSSPEQLASTPLATPAGGIQPLDQLVSLEVWNVRLGQTRSGVLIAAARSRWRLRNQTECHWKNRSPF